MSITLINKLDSGHFGAIYKAKKEDGSYMAVKIIPPRELKYIELDILARLRSPYLVKSCNQMLVDTKLGKGIAMQLKENNLSYLDTKHIAYHQLKRIMISALYGLKCMHDNNYLHLDISLENILYDVGEGGDLTSYIGDFGYAARCSDSRNGIVISAFAKRSYAPPEILKAIKNNEVKYHYNDRTDIWSMGMVFLILLGAKFKFLSIDTYLSTLENIDEDFIEEKIRVYNKNKMSPKEALEMKELLVNMLKIKPEERMSTVDVEKCAFVKYENIKNSCFLEGLKEVYYLPYISTQVKEGIKRIQEAYQTNEKLYQYDQALEEYFLTLQTFIRLMSRSKPELDNNELKSMIDTSMGVAQNYYHHGIKNGNFDTANKLDGETGYNPYFYQAQSIDDLVLINYFLTDNDNLVAFYNLIQPNEIYTVLRQDYEYTNVSKHKIKIKDFFQIAVPKQKTKENSIIVSPEEYHNALPNMNEKSSNIAKIKIVEEEFREEILQHIKENISSNPDNQAVDVIYDVLQGKFTSSDYTNLKNIIGDKNISQKFANLINYGYLLMSEGQINSAVESEKEYVIVSDGNRSSLLYIKDKKVIHYYSDKNEKIANYYQEKGYSYENNFDYGIGNCCILREPCLIFNIYYNRKLGVTDFSTKCLERHTFFLVLAYLTLF